MNRQLIAAALVLIGAVLWFLEHRLSQIENNLAQRLAAIEAGQQTLTQSQAVISQRLDQFDKVIALLQQRPAESEEPDVVKPLKNIRQAAIKSGLYVIDRKIKMQNATRNGYYESDFTIYHIKAELSDGNDGGEHAVLNIGLAVGDLTTPPVMYIDYDNDNIVDANMMRDFASIGPLGPLLRRGINERNSQAAYNEFLDHHTSASYTSLEMIEQSGQSIASSLWSFIKEQSSSMLSWIDAHEDEDGTKPQPPPAPAPTAAEPAAP